MESEKYIVAFIDILAFKNLVSESEKEPIIFNNINNALEQFYRLTKREAWQEAQILMQVEECAQVKNLEDFYVDGIAHTICFSDSIIITIKAEDKLNERLSALIAQISKIGSNLFLKNILIRGAISYGDLHLIADKNICFGEALIKAYELESEKAIYPRIILSKSILNKLNYPVTKRNRMPYHQYIERLDDGLTGFSPIIFYQVMQNAPDIISKDNLESDLSIIRKNIIKNLDESIEDSNYFAKHNWLKKYYNQLTISNCEFNKIEPIIRPGVTQDVFYKDKCN